MAGSGLLVGVKEMHLVSEKAECWLFNGETWQGYLHQRASFSSRGCTYYQSVKRLTGTTWRLLLPMLPNEAMVHSMKGVTFRHKQRRMQLKSFIKKEVRLVLKSKSFRRLAMLGPINFEVDPIVFDMWLPQQWNVCYNYKGGNLDKLDDFLRSKASSSSKLYLDSVV